MSDFNQRLIVKVFALRRFFFMSNLSVKPQLYASC